MPTEAAPLPPVRRSALLASIHDLSHPPTFLSTAISTATRQTSENLRIIIFSHLFDPPADAAPRTGRALSGTSVVDGVGFSHTENWDGVQRLLTYVYVQATRVAQEMDKVLMDIDVLVRGTQEPAPEELVQDAERTYYVPPPDSDSAVPVSLRARAGVVTLGPEHGHAPQAPPAPLKSDPTLPPLFPVAALGGTFDHLHAGHKILLSMGAWIANEKLIVGITDDALLQKKAYKEALENLPVRIARVRAFLELFKPGLQYDIVPISDVYGPTAWDPNIQALVVSKETLPGAASIHKHRQEKSLSSLHTFIIDVISATEASLDDQDAELLKNTKTSSTFIRQWIIEKRSMSSHI